MKRIFIDGKIDQIQDQEEKKIQLKKQQRKMDLALVLTGFLSSMLHTCLVMGSIYFLLAQQYAAAKEVAKELEIFLDSIW